jgi:hypothetical protein
MDSLASPFPNRPRIDVSICRQPSAFKFLLSELAAEELSDEAETKKDFGQSNRSAASGAEFWNCTGRYPRHSRQTEAAAEAQETIARNRTRINSIRVFAANSS